MWFNLLKYIIKITQNRKGINKQKPFLFEASVYQK